MFKVREYRKEIFVFRFLNFNNREILILIQKQIELQKSELNCREREIKLRERELAEREKRFKEKPIDTTSVTSAKSEPLLGMKSIIIDTKTPITNDQDMTPVCSFILRDCLTNSFCFSKGITRRICNKNDFTNC